MRALDSRSLVVRSTLEAALPEGLCTGRGCRAETGSEPALAKRHLKVELACRLVGPQKNRSSGQIVWQQS